MAKQTMLDNVYVVDYQSTCLPLFHYRETTID
jgi:hypothetical protein